jgi:glutaminase
MWVFASSGARRCLQSYHPFNEDLMTHNPTLSANALLRRRFVGLGVAGVLATGLPLPFITRIARARASSEPVTEARLQQLVADAHKRFASVTDGKNADYIPYLATVPSTLFGIAMVTPDGKVIEAGDTNYAFAIESIAKVFTLSLVMSESGPNVVKQKLGANATGLPFNSVIALELHKGNPLSPLVNAGAMATVSLVKAGSSNERWQKIAANMDGYADAELSLNQAVFKSESDTNQHNRAIAYLLQSAGFMYSDPMEACDVYTRECSVGITPKNLAIMAGTLANGGVNPLSKKRLLDQAYVPKILAEMAVEGLYDTSGAWQYDVGLPAKSGVGGGIMAISPGNWAIAAFSPPLDGAGNSVRSQLAIAWIADQLKANIYAG